jgi:hypothetical protein
MSGSIVITYPLRSSIRFVMTTPCQ